MDEQPLQEPHGVCADRHGLIFVADRRAHAVRVFDERCGTIPVPSGSGGNWMMRARSVASYDDERHKVGLPFAVACNHRDQLAVADYVGTVRVFTYFEDSGWRNYVLGLKFIYYAGVLTGRITGLASPSVVCPLSACPNKTAQKTKLGVEL